METPGRGEELIRRFTPFIMAVVSRATGQFIRMGEDDEASIGLMAFNEAIDC
jgi:RNA polymerase sigma factor